MYRVVFPFELKLPNTTADAEGQDATYSLFAVVVHVGSGPHHGARLARGWLLPLLLPLPLPLLVLFVLDAMLSCMLRAKRCMVVGVLVGSSFRRQRVRTTAAAAATGCCCRPLPLQATT